MILDGLLVFSSAQALTSTADSTNVIDLLNFRDLGVTERPMSVFISAGATFQSAGSSTLSISLAGSTDNSTYTTMATMPAVAKATLVAGVDIGNFKLPKRVAGQALPRYLKLVYTVAVADFTTGNLNAALVLDRQGFTAYPAGHNVVN